MPSSAQRAETAQAERKMISTRTKAALAEARKQVAVTGQREHPEIKRLGCPAGAAHLRPICAEPQAEEPTMPHSKAVNWQPISEMPLIASMIDEALEDTRAHVKTLTEASARPHVMDDATVDRIDRVHVEQMVFVDIYAEQIGRWRNERPSVRQTRELDRMEEQNRKLRDATTTVLALSRDLRKGTIERVMEKSDIELGLEAVLRGRPATRR